MAKPRVYVARRIHPDGLRLLEDFSILGIWQEKRLMPRAEQLQVFADCHGIVSTMDVMVDEQLLGRCPLLKVVSNHAVGYNNVDVAACSARGVLVGNTPGVLSETTADLAFALILATARRIVELAEWVKNDQWTPAVGLLDNLGTDVHHATLGIFGLGRIGLEVARRAAGFGMQLLYHNRRRNPEAEKQLGAVYMDKEALLRQSDFVSIHLPLSEKTRHYIGPEELQLMKPSAILINTARGPVVDQQALVQALQQGQIAGAGLDVADPEPVRANDRLLGLPQVIVLPHVGSATGATRAKMAVMAARNLIAGLSGQPMVSCVNPEAYGRGRNAALSKTGH